MARIATVEDIEGIREEQDIGEPPKPQEESSEPVDPEQRAQDEEPKPSTSRTGKCIATVEEVQNAFDIINTLRYSQPTHLQG